MSAFSGLDVDLIQSRLTGDPLRKLLLYKSTASTNDVAWKYASTTQNDGLVVLAEQQEAGRGRQGRQWYSPPRQSILCSILKLDLRIEAEMVTLAAAVAVAETVDCYVRGHTQIKWPNDIWVEGRKAAGILVESKPERPARDYVIGIGVNCHQDSAWFDRTALRAPATSIDIERDGPVDRNALAADMLNSVDRWLDEARKDSTPVIARWKEMSRLLGAHVVLEYDQRQFAGHCVGVDPIKGLILQLERGGVRMFDAAHTTMVRQTLP